MHFMTVCNLEMIKAQFPIGQYFIGIDIIKEIEKNVISGNLSTP